MFAATKFSLILFGLAQLLKYASWRYPAFRARLKERNLVAANMVSSCRAGCAEA